MRTLVCLAVTVALGGYVWGVGRGGGGGGARMAPAARPAPNPGARPAPGFAGGQQGGGARPGGPSGGWNAPGTIQTGRPATPGPQVGSNGAIGQRPQQPMQGGSSVFRPGDSSTTRPSSSVLYPSGPSGGWNAPGTITAGNSHPNNGGLASVAKTTTINQAGGTRYVNSGAINSVGKQVRTNYTNVNAFNNNAWWGRYPNAWRPAAWNRSASYWAYANWAAWSAFGGYAAPVYYDYGSNIVLEGESVYQDGAAIGTQDIYADQAINIASTGRQAQAGADDTWMSLGVFAMVQGNETNPGKLFQLAVNKAGVIRGNYYDDLTQATLPVYGQVDSRSQRACWTVGDKKDVVYEAGAANLTQDQATMLVHLGKDKTQQWALVRLPEPAGQ